MSTSSKVFLVFLILTVGVGYYALQKWDKEESAPRPLATEPVTLEIPLGTNARDVAQILEDNGVIRDARAFSTAARVEGRAGGFQAGTYTFQPDASTEQLFDQLTAGPPRAATWRVTIPEGLTVTQTLERLEQAEGSHLSAAQYREALPTVPVPGWVPQQEIPEGGDAYEGLLFPDTYEFSVEQDAATILGVLVQQTDTVITETGFAERNNLSTYETLVLASLIEREARLAEERPIISSVIHNRIGDGQALQIDATVVYGIEIATGERPSRLLLSDYEFETPWSTYLYPGLPPTPISGVGRASLEAAANPEDTPYYFYVVENEETGAHRFTETLAQHQQAISEIRGQ